MAGPRERLGQSRGFTRRHTLYLTPEAVEQDEHEQYELARRRVLLEEAQLVTLHRRRDWPTLLVLGLAVVLTAVLCWAIAREPGARTAGLVGAGIMGTPLVLALVLRAALGTHRVTVYGRRTKVWADYALRPGRARAVFLRVAARAREAQRQA
jgi:hypothetical protein